MDDMEVYPAGMPVEGFKQLTEGRMVSRRGRRVFKPARYRPDELLKILKDMEARGCRADALTGCECFNKAIASKDDGK